MQVQRIASGHSSESRSLITLAQTVWEASVCSRLSLWTHSADPCNHWEWQYCKGRFNIVETPLIYGETSLWMLRQNWCGKHSIMQWHGVHAKHKADSRGLNILWRLCHSQLSLGEPDRIRAGENILQVCTSNNQAGRRRVVSGFVVIAGMLSFITRACSNHREGDLLRNRCQMMCHWFAAKRFVIASMHKKMGKQHLLRFRLQISGTSAWALRSAGSAPDLPFPSRTGYLRSRRCHLRTRKTK